MLPVIVVSVMVEPVPVVSSSMPPPLLPDVLLAYVGGVSLHVSRRYLMIGVFLVVFACLAAGSTVAYSWRILDMVP